MGSFVQTAYYIEIQNKSTKTTKMTPSDISTVRKLTTWIGPFGMFLSHGIAFCVLYLVLTTFVQSLKFHYEIDNIALTPVFARIEVISEYVLCYSLISIVVIFADALIISMIAKYGPRWLSAYSHTVHSCLIVMLLVTFASMMHPLFWDDARKANVGVALNTNRFDQTAETSK